MTSCTCTCIWSAFLSPGLDTSTLKLDTCVPRLPCARVFGSLVAWEANKSCKMVLGGVYFGVSFLILLFQSDTRDTACYTGQLRVPVLML